MRKSLQIAALCLIVPTLAFIVTGCSFSSFSTTPPKKHTRTLEISSEMPSNQIFSATTSNGNIKTLGIDENQCTVIAKITARGHSDEEAKSVAEQVIITIVEEGAATNVVVEKPDIELKKYIAISFDITLPKDSNLNLKTSNGNIDITNINGDANAGTSNGNVTSNNVIGPVDFRTSNGNVTCRDVSKNVKAKSSNGSIVIDCSNDADPALVINAGTSNGSVTFKAPANYSARVSATTSNGTVASSLPVTVQGKMKKNRLNGVIGNGKGTLNLNTSNGSITIH